MSDKRKYEPSKMDAYQESLRQMQSIEDGWLHSDTDKIIANHKLLARQTELERKGGVQAQEELLHQAMATYLESGGNKYLSGKDETNLRTALMQGYGTYETWNGNEHVSPEAWGQWNRIQASLDFYKRHPWPLDFPTTHRYEKLDPEDQPFEGDEAVDHYVSDAAGKDVMARRLGIQNGLYYYEETAFDEDYGILYTSRPVRGTVHLGANPGHVPFFPRQIYGGDRSARENYNDVKMARLATDTKLTYRNRSELPNPTQPTTPVVWLPEKDLKERRFEDILKKTGPKIKLLK